MERSRNDYFPKFEHLGDAVPYVGRIHKIVEHIRLFEDFEREEIEFLAPYLACYRAPGGGVIIGEGDPGDFMLLVLDGSAEIVKMDKESGVPVRVGVAGPGKVLGEMSLVDGEPRFASCLALEPTLFAVLDRDTLSHLIADEPRIGIKVLMQLIVLLNQRLRLVSSELMRQLGGIKPARSPGIAP
jgi:CRP/FNR family cyclic AMP-dependent transcriptional regulator